MTLPHIHARFLEHVITLAELLDHYGLLHKLVLIDNPSAKVRFYCCECPFHHGDSTDQFLVDLTTNTWFCVGVCARGGGIVDLVKEVDGVHSRGAALELLQFYFSAKLKQMSQITTFPFGKAQKAPGKPCR